MVQPTPLLPNNSVFELGWSLDTGVGLLKTVGDTNCLPPRGELWPDNFFDQFDQCHGPCFMSGSFGRNVTTNPLTVMASPVNDLQTNQVETDAGRNQRGRVSKHRGKFPSCRLKKNLKKGGK